MLVPTTGVFTSQGAQSPIRNPPKASQRCNPPQSAIHHAEDANNRLMRVELELRGPRNGLEIGARNSRR
eukprot:15430752-Alexandrium_andersonii.AAC.1